MNADKDDAVERYRVVARAMGVFPSGGPQAARDIVEFFDDRPWHQNVGCRYDKDSQSLVLQADNDYDETGLALLDEFSDAICASISRDDLADEGGKLFVESVSKI